MPSTKGVKGRKVIKIYATRSRTGTSASQGPSNTPSANPATSSNMSGPNPAASPASPVLTSNSGARIDHQISGNTGHQTRSTLDHHPISMSNPGGSIGSHAASLPAPTAMVSGSGEMPMIPAPPGYLPGHRDWIKVYGKIQKCDHCNGRSKEGVIYMCQPCKIYICKPCAVAERHNRDPHDPHVLDAHAVSWYGWERGANRPAQPARPRGRSSKVVDKGKTDPALAGAATATATDRQASQPANAASDAIVVSCHPIVPPTIAPAADSSHKRTVSALGSIELPPSKQSRSANWSKSYQTDFLPSTRFSRACPRNFAPVPKTQPTTFLPKSNWPQRSIFLPTIFLFTRALPVFQRATRATTTAASQRITPRRACPYRRPRFLSPKSSLLLPRTQKTRSPFFLPLPEFSTKKTPTLRLRPFIETTITNSALALRPLVDT